MQFTQGATREMIFQIKPKLVQILFDLECLLNLTKNEIIITSLIRPKTTDSGVHALGRGADLSIKNLTLKEQQYIIEYVNSKYIYDPLRKNLKSAILNDGGNYNGIVANHIHIQVS